MAAPILYRSTDSSAPVLSGTAGALVGVLRGCLVDGYAGKAAAGWSAPFTATNAVVLRMGAGNQFYLDVNDNGASNGLTGASGQEAAVRGYEVMTAASTGTGPFPTTAQVAAATANWRKSATANATARAWFVIADDRSFLLGVLDGDTASVYKLYAFGDIYSFKSGDGFRTAITVREVVNSTATTGTLGNALVTGLGSTTTGWYLPRIAAGTGTATAAGLLGTGSVWETSGSFTASLDGNVYQSRLHVGDSASPWLRGYVRGLYEILTPVGLTDGDTYTGTGDLAGRSFTVVRGFGGSAARCLAIETTAWDSSS